jgi:sulfur relay (sulfurtransferase) DsrF/TusC family protein
LESPLEVVFKDETVEIAIEALECLFNSYSLLEDPVLNLLDDGVFPVETICEVIACNVLY